MPVQFDIAVFAANEAATIESCVTAIDRACHGHTAQISVLLNGTTDNCISILQTIDIHNVLLRVYSLAVADKSNAINNFLYFVRDRSAIAHFFVDGYVRITHGALQALVDALVANPSAQIASGVPIRGRSAKAIADDVRAGGSEIRGNLFAMRPAFADHFVAEQLRLPRGLYRGDPLLASMAKHDFDALNKPWDNNRVIGVLDATYDVRPLSPFRWQDIRRQYRREINQARGWIENEAIKEIIYRNGYSALPIDSNEMIVTWLQRNRRSLPRSLKAKFFTHQAIKKLSIGPRVEPIQAELIFERPAWSDQRNESKFEAITSARHI